MHTLKENRPKIHFTPETGWINDPNGLVHIDGTYHMFFQHYPDGVTWGPMHWGHAVSEDLLHWEELPIALYPDELGAVFSGSCVYDKENVSGLKGMDIPPLGIKGKPPLIAVYTSHLMKAPDANGVRQDVEQQSIAYSTDYRHFEKYYGNPVIANTRAQRPDFRDPKCFYNPLKECYSMVVSAGNHVEFYQSKDLKVWEKTGEFEPGEHGLRGTCECPDCFPVTADDGTTKWILLISMIVPDDLLYQRNDRFDRMRQITQYFVGEFDGDTFHDTELADEMLLVDYGTDHYAAVTFQNLDDKIMIAWCNNWEYARSCVTGAYNGRMTLARKLGLRKTENGYRLCSTFAGLDALREKAETLKQKKNRIIVDSFGLHVKSKGNGKIVISNNENEQLVIELTEDSIIVDRSKAGKNDFHDSFHKMSMSVNVAPRTHQEDEIDLVWDKSILEVIADQGLAGFSVNVYPKKAYSVIEISGDLHAEFYEIK